MERINVTVRSRPLSPEDAKSSPWRISGNSISIPNQPTKFDFDRIFREESRTAEVYESRTKDIVAAAVRGFNGTVFAYGQTSSGKTHTMRGSTAEPGVIPLAVHDLFETIQQDMDREFLLRMSYMEIYNEEINDLLAPEHRRLQIHESIERGIFVAGLKEEIVSSPKQVLKFMDFGEAHRHIGETNMNAYSSRSHTIFRMIIESREKTEDENADSSCDAVRVSVLNLVDLAGSERAAKTGAEGVRLKEGSHINKSLMTLGTVIKKLSEGAESQGGHVPYRDSKLTRILQPALGGNANTAIICNITLAQVHADETKSSLQFASRALRVTNCVHVNEVLTDAALLKRQKKEIEELRAKLQGSHSEHLGEEILNLRNTLLQSELERERIALELEEEKKAQAERDRRLLEQAKKIENLSSMVLCSNRDDIRDKRKKEKRRDTWCPGNLSKETLRELYSTVQEKASEVKPSRPEREMGPLLPFQELVEDETMNSCCKQEENNKNISLEDCSLPDQHSLLHVTSRRKPPLRKKSLPVDNNELIGLQTEYEELLLKHETQKTTSEIKIDYLTRKVAEANFYLENEYKDNSAYHANRSIIQCNNNKSSMELDAILVIKQLQEKISILEMEKSSSLQNLDSVVELATEQNICAREKNDELYAELSAAQEEAKVAREQLASVDNFESLTSLSLEIQQIMSEVQHSRNHVDNVCSIVDELFQSLSCISNLFADLRSSASQNSMQMRSILVNYDSLHSSLRNKVNELEKEKLLVYNQSEDLQKRVEELSVSGQNSSKALAELSDQHEKEMSELLSEIQALQNEISFLSSSALAKEKESMRKDLEKTKAKFRETESKLRNAIQEKTKLEGEKACAEREIKHLHGQKMILERDIGKRDSIAGRRRDSVLDRSSNVWDSKRAKSHAISVDQEDYKKLEVLAFEMETTIASLEEQLAIANEDKEQAISTTENLVLEVQDLSDKLNLANSDTNSLQEIISSLRSSLEESTSCNKNMERSISMLIEEKDELAMQLTDALLAIEEERAIWSAKEKTSIGAIEEKSKLYKSEIAVLSNAMSEATNELEACRKECSILKESLAFLEEKAELEKACSKELSIENERLRNDLQMADDQSKRSQEATNELEACRKECSILKESLAFLEERAELEKACSKELSIENERLRNDLQMADDQSKRSQEILTSKLEMLSLEHRRACEEVDKLQMDVMTLSKDRENLSTRIRELDSKSVHVDDFQLMKSKAEVEELTRKLSTVEVKAHNDEKNYNKDKTKLRMMLRGAQAKLDNLRVRYAEAMDEIDYMNKRFEEASAKLKGQLSSYGTEVLNLKKQLSVCICKEGL